MENDLGFKINNTRLFFKLYMLEKPGGIFLMGNHTRKSQNAMLIK